jgi:hypothetical protein
MKIFLQLHLAGICETSLPSLALPAFLRRSAKQYANTNHILLLCIWKGWGYAVLI